jgi:dCMP deaminase
MQDSFEVMSEQIEQLKSQLAEAQKPVARSGGPEWMRKWDERFMRIAREYASWSKDRSTQVGCVVVLDRRILSGGYNGFPRGCDDDVEERHQRPLKYLWTSHAEENAVCNAVRTGTGLDRSTAYVTMFPCAACARMLVQSGVHRVVAPRPDIACPRWGDNHRVALDIFGEAGVLVEPYEEKS